MPWTFTAGSDAKICTPKLYIGTVQVQPGATMTTAVVGTAGSFLYYINAISGYLVGDIETGMTDGSEAAASIKTATGKTLSISEKVMGEGALIYLTPAGYTALRTYIHNKTCTVVLDEQNPAITGSGLEVGYCRTYNGVNVTCNFLGKAGDLNKVLIKWESEIGNADELFTMTTISNA